MRVNDKSTPIVRSDQGWLKAQAGKTTALGLKASKKI